MPTTLAEFIQQTRDAREYKRAVALQMVEQGLAPALITTTLQVSAPFISKWKRIYREQGLEGLRIHYKGPLGKLTRDEREQTLTWLAEQTSCNLATLQTYLKTTFGVEYRSPQSYYTLFREAGLSWKKAQASNPKKNRSRWQPNRLR